MHPVVRTVLQRLGLGLVTLFFVSIINAFGGWDGQVETSADLVPSYQRLLRYVGHDLVSVRSTPDGLLKTRTVTNPLLSPIAWFDSPVVAMAVLIPTISGFEESGDRVRSAARALLRMG